MKVPSDLQKEARIGNVGFRTPYVPIFEKKKVNPNLCEWPSKSCWLGTKNVHSESFSVEEVLANILDPRVHEWQNEVTTAIAVKVGIQYVVLRLANTRPCLDFHCRRPSPQRRQCPKSPHFLITDARTSNEQNKPKS